MPALTHAAAYSGKRLDAIVIDAPIWYHAPKLVMWCVLEALALTLGVWITRKCPLVLSGFAHCFLSLLHSHWTADTSWYFVGWQSVAFTMPPDMQRLHTPASPLNLARQ